MPNVSSLVESAIAKIAPYLKNKAVRTVGGAAAGLGAAGLENKFIAPDASATTHGINDVVGASTGAFAAHHPWLALGSLPFKQMALAALNDFEKDAPTRKAIADTSLQAAQADKATAGINLQNASSWKPGDIAAGAGAAGLLGGAGMYAYNSLHKKPAKKPGRNDVVVRGNPANRIAQKVRIDVPASAFPADFFSSVVGAENSPSALEKVKMASVQITRAEALIELQHDLNCLPC